jgi:hypothetical protein
MVLKRDSIPYSGFSPAMRVAVAASSVLLRVGTLSMWKAGRINATHLEAAIGAKVNLGVDEGAVILEPLECVSRVSVLVVVTVGCAAIREKNHDLVNGLRVLGEVVLKISSMSIFDR